MVWKALEAATLLAADHVDARVVGVPTIKPLAAEEILAEIAGSHVFTAEEHSIIGGLGGVLIGWLAGQGLNVLALVYLAQQSSQTGGIPPSVAVSTPLWLPLFALAFATIIGLLSGLYPALRAATMVPVNALKYE